MFTQKIDSILQILTNSMHNKTECENSVLQHRTLIPKHMIGVLQGILLVEWTEVWNKAITLRPNYKNILRFIAGFSQVYHTSIV